MSGNPKLISEVTNVAVSFLESQPPIMVVQASGEVPTAGWTHAGLSRVVYVTPPEDGIQGYEFMATPPSGAVIQVVSPVEAVDRWHDPAKWVKGVRVKAENNSMQEPALSVTN
jgi:hypothetical protein